MAELPQIDVSAPPLPPDTARSDTDAASDSDAASRDTPDIRPPRDTGIEWPLQGRRPNPYPNYIPIQPRGPTGWGRDDEHLTNFRNYPGMPPPSPYIPQPYQANQIIQQVGGFFKQFGSNQSQIYAAAMLGARGNFLKGLLAGQTAAANAQLKLYELNAVRLAEEEKQRAYKYGEIFTLYGDNKDPSLLFRKLTEAAQGHDDGMMAAIATGKVETIKKLIDYRDTHNDALLKLNEVRTKIEAEREKIEKEKTETEERRQWLSPSAPSTPTGGGPAPGATSTAPLGGGAPATGAPTGAPGSPAGAAPGATPGVSSYALPPANPRVDTAARAKFMDRTSGEPAFAKGVVEDRLGQYERTFDAIEADPKLTTREQVVAAVRSALPEMGQQLEEYLAGKMTMTGRDTTKGHVARLIRLGEKTGSDVGPETGKTRAATEIDFARGRGAQTLAAIGTTYRHAGLLEPKLADLEKFGALARLGGTLYGIGPLVADKDVREKMIRLDDDLHVMSGEFYKAMVGGVGAERGREAMERLTRWRSQDPDVTRASVSELRELLRERLEELKDQYVAGTRGKPSDMLKRFDEDLGRSTGLGPVLHAIDSLPVGALTTGSGTPAAPARAAPGSAPTAPRVRQNGHTFERQPDGSYKAID